jgi:hypothetical protein
MLFDDELAQSDNPLIVCHVQIFLIIGIILDERYRAVAIIIVLLLKPYN